MPDQAQGQYFETPDPAVQNKTEPDLRLPEAAGGHKKRSLPDTDLSQREPDKKSKPSHNLSYLWESRQSKLSSRSSTDPASAAFTILYDLT